MKAVVVFESVWGNTAAVARAIAEGIGADASALNTTDATPATVADVDLLVVGAPLMAFGLPSEKVREGIRDNPGSGAPPPDLTHPSMRSWLATLAEGRGRSAAFETKIRWSPGSSAAAIQRELAARGYSAVAKPQKFVVAGKYGPLKPGELERARAWGAELAAALG